MKIHSDDAWDVASYWGHLLASDTRTLAAQIDDLINKKLEEAALVAERYSYSGADRIRSLKHGLD